MPLYSADALVLRTYPFGEADAVVVFLTPDRGKKRGVAERARRPKSSFSGALAPLTLVRVAYFEREGRDLVGLNYAERVRSPLGVASPEALGYSHYFAELLDEWAPDADVDERVYRLGVAMLDALMTGVPVEPLARYFECWLLRLQGVYPTDLELSVEAEHFVDASRHLRPAELGELSVAPHVLRELEYCHRVVIRQLLDRDMRSLRVIQEMRRVPAN
ncbi:MAG: DNA repair protein RecO [Acidobacteria bacterium]|nr:DNA repair protein RecO [Acidobacteriota bacterium]